MNRSELFPFILKSVRSSSTILPAEFSKDVELEMDEDDLKTNIVQDDGISVYKFTDNFLLKELTKSLGNSPSHEGLENITDNN